MATYYNNKRPKGEALDDSPELAPPSPPQVSPEAAPPAPRPAAPPPPPPSANPNPNPGGFYQPYGGEQQGETAKQAGDSEAQQQQAPEPPPQAPTTGYQPQGFVGTAGYTTPAQRAATAKKPAVDDEPAPKPAPAPPPPPTAGAAAAPPPPPGGAPPLPPTTGFTAGDIQMRPPSILPNLPTQVPAPAPVAGVPGPQPAGTSFTPGGPVSVGNTISPAELAAQGAAAGKQVNTYSTPTTQQTSVINDVIDPAVLAANLKPGGPPALPPEVAPGNTLAEPANGLTPYHNAVLAGTVTDPEALTALKAQQAAGTGAFAKPGTPESQIFSGTAAARPASAPPPPPGSPAAAGGATSTPPTLPPTTGSTMGPGTGLTTPTGPTSGGTGVSTGTGGGQPTPPIPGGQGTGGFNASLFNQGADALQARLQRVREQARRNNAEAMARRGIVGSSVEADTNRQLEADLAAQEQQGLFDIANQGNQYGLQNRALDLQERGLTGSQALQQAQLEWEKNQFGQNLGFQQQQADRDNQIRQRQLELQAQGQTAQQAYQQAALEWEKNSGQQQIDISKRGADVNQLYQLWQMMQQAAPWLNTQTTSGKK